MVVLEEGTSQRSHSEKHTGFSNSRSKEKQSAFHPLKAPSAKGS